MKKVIPLMQEFISNNDGDDKQDCEVNASKRWLNNFTNPTNKKLIILGDDLYSREPMIKKVLEQKHSYVFVAKPTFIYNYINKLAIKNPNGDTQHPPQEVNWCEVICYQ